MNNKVHKRDVIRVAVFSILFIVAGILFRKTLVGMMLLFMGIGLAVAGLIMAANFCAAVFHKCPFCGKFFMEERKESFEKKPVFCPRCGMRMPKSFRNDIF